MNINFRLLKFLILFATVNFVNLSSIHATYDQDTEPPEYTKLRCEYFKKSLSQIKEELYSDRLNFIKREFKLGKNDEQIPIFISYAFESKTLDWIKTTLSTDLENVGFGEML